MSGSIYVESVGKVFRNVDRGRASTLKALFLTRPGGSDREKSWGLRDVTFGVAPGRAVGVVGRNGAGKSTLLRIIGGVTRANEGRVRIKGRIGALLEITAGLTDDLTGRENIFLMGVIAGMLHSEVDAQFEDIVAFAELAESIDRPVRTYSTGMKMRLSFSVAVHGHPEVLLIDEVLAVGDAAFQAKSFERIRSIKDSGCTIFLVSHDAEQIRALCDDVLFLRHGRVVAFGPTEETLALFEASMEEVVVHAIMDALPQPSATLERDVNRFGSHRAEIGRAALFNAEGAPVGEIATGAGLRIRFAIRAAHTIEAVIAVVGIYASDLTPCLEVNSSDAGMTLDVGPAEQEVSMEFERLDLAAGEYHATIGLFSSDWHEVLDYHAEVYSFTVVGKALGKGYLRPRLNWFGGQAGSHVEF